jgi:hypothetical protein
MLLLFPLKMKKARKGRFQIFGGDLPILAFASGNPTLLVRMIAN